MSVNLIKMIDFKEKEEEKGKRRCFINFNFLSSGLDNQDKDYLNQSLIMQKILPRWKLVRQKGSTKN